MYCLLTEWWSAFFETWHLIALSRTTSWHLTTAAQACKISLRHVNHSFSSVVGLKTVFRLVAKLLNSYMANGTTWEATRQFHLKPNTSQQNVGRRRIRRKSCTTLTAAVTWQSFEWVRACLHCKQEKSVLCATARGRASLDCCRMPARFVRHKGEPLTQGQVARTGTSGVCATLIGRELSVPGELHGVSFPWTIKHKFHPI